MRVQVVVASVNELQNIRMFRSMLERESSEILVIDEGNQRLRRRNRHLLDGLAHRFYGPRERRAYFSRTFGTTGTKASHVIPARCHAETSFGFLLAYEERPDIVIELDDDTYPASHNSIVDGHVSNLRNQSCPIVISSGGWYNTLENAELDVPNVFPRGHPYNVSLRSGTYSWSNAESKAVLNMGLWLGHPDLDALTILSRGGLDGRCDVKSTGIKRSRLAVGKGTYFSLCSMNVAFKPEILPAFYQLYMNYMGVDRFDDIWSGVLLKKVTDHLGVHLSMGAPTVVHEKRPRDIFRDLRAELEGLAINEILWRTVDTLEIDGNDYWTAYRSLVCGLERAAKALGRSDWRRFLRLQTQKMHEWLRVIDKI